jgi:hypothetical protein
VREQHPRRDRRVRVRRVAHREGERVTDVRVEVEQAVLDTCITATATTVFEIDASMNATSALARTSCARFAGP